MTKKILFGGVLAGLILFIWSALAHMALPIGSMGIKSLPNEEVVIAALKTNVNQPGLYFFPGEGVMQAESLSKEQQEAAMAAWMKKIETGPRGIMVYHPTGTTPMSMSQFGTELLADIVGGIIVAFALAMALGRLRTWGARVGFVTLLGLLPWVIVDLSYYNWYGFPAAYELGELLDQVIGMFLAGIVLAFVFRRDGVTAA
jgi:hypothetical protein